MKDKKGHKQLSVFNKISKQQYINTCRTQRQVIIIYCFYKKNCQDRFTISPPTLF